MRNVATKGLEKINQIGKSIARLRLTDRDAHRMCSKADLFVVGAVKQANTRRFYRESRGCRRTGGCSLLIAVERDPDHEQRADYNRQRADKRKLFQQGDNGRPPGRKFVHTREAIVCHVLLRDA